MLIVWAADYKVLLPQREPGFWVLLPERCVPFPALHHLNCPSQAHFFLYFNTILIFCALSSAVTRFCSDVLGHPSVEQVLLQLSVIVRSFSLQCFQI